MVHYGALDHEGRKRTPEDWKREEAEFQARIGNEEITHLPEGQFVVIEKELMDDKENSHSDPFRMLDETPALIERVKPKDSNERSRLAVYIAEQTIKHLGMQENRIGNALQALRSGERGNIPELKELNKLAEELDQVAFDAQDTDDAAYDVAFCKARAANALETAFNNNAQDALIETLYEAFAAVDQNEALLLKWIDEFEERKK